MTEWDHEWSATDPIAGLAEPGEVGHGTEFSPTAAKAPPGAPQEAGARTLPPGWERRDGKFVFHLTEDHFRDIHDIIDGFRHRPDDAIPGWWAECPICAGEGCPRCEGIGRLHPKLAGWLDDALLDACDAYVTFQNLLADGSTPARWRSETFLALNEVLTRASWQLHSDEHRAEQAGLSDA